MSTLLDGWNAGVKRTLDSIGLKNQVQPYKGKTTTVVPANPQGSGNKETLIPAKVVVTDVVTNVADAPKKVSTKKTSTKASKKVSDNDYMAILVNSKAYTGMTGEQMAESGKISKANIGLYNKMLAPVEVARPVVSDTGATIPAVQVPSEGLAKYAEPRMAGYGGDPITTVAYPTVAPEGYTGAAKADWEETQALYNDIMMKKGLQTGAQIRAAADNSDAMIAQRNAETAREIAAMKAIQTASNGFN